MRYLCKVWTWASLTLVILDRETGALVRLFWRSTKGLTLAVVVLHYSEIQQRRLSPLEQLLRVSVYKCGIRSIVIVSTDRQKWSSSKVNLPSTVSIVHESFQLGIDQLTELVRERSPFLITGLRWPRKNTSTGSSRRSRRIVLPELTFDYLSAVKENLCWKSSRLTKWRTISSLRACRPGSDFIPSTKSIWQPQPVNALSDLDRGS